MSSSALPQDQEVVGHNLDLSPSASNTAISKEIPPVRGLSPRRTFANDNELIDEVVAKVTQTAINRNVYNETYKPPPGDIKWLKSLSGVVLLSPEFQKVYLQHILQTKSMDLAAGFAIAAGAAKLVADEKNQGNVICQGEDFTPLDQNGNELCDGDGRALTSEVSNDAAQNKARILAGGVGTLVKFWKLESMREWGHLEDSVFISTPTGPGICKCYTGVVSAVGETMMEINPFETVGGQGFAGIARDRRHYYVAVASEGSDYPAVVSPDGSPDGRVFFTRDRAAPANGLLNLNPIVVEYGQMLALAPGRLTTESLVRFVDKMKLDFPLQKGGNLKMSDDEVEAYRKQKQPGPYQYFRYIEGEIVIKTTRIERIESPTRSESGRKSPQICHNWNNLRCELGRECPQGRRHICRTCEGDHTERECDRRTRIAAEQRRRKSEKRLHHEGRPTQIKAKKARTRDSYRPSHPNGIRGSNAHQKSRATRSMRPGDLRGSHRDSHSDSTSSQSSRPRKNVPGLVSMKSGYTRAGDEDSTAEVVKDLFQAKMDASRGSRSNKDWDRVSSRDSRQVSMAY